MTSEACLLKGFMCLGTTNHSSTDNQRVNKVTTQMQPMKIRCQWLPSIQQRFPVGCTIQKGIFELQRDGRNKNRSVLVLHCI